MESVCSVCTSIRNNTKHDTGFHSLLTATRRAFRQAGFDLSIKSNRRKSLSSEEFYVNAYYDPIDDHNNDTPIEVIVYHNFNNKVVWDQLHVTEMLIQIFDAVTHEFKHQRQSRKRNYEAVRHHSDTVEQYLSDPDEIDAYSLSIAVELCRSIGKFRALRFMARFSSLSKLKFNNKYVSPNLFAYVQQFGTLDNQILKKLAKKVYIRLQKVDIDHIFM